MKSLYSSNHSPPLPFPPLHSEIVEEERQLDLLTQRRGFAGIQRDPNAPEKPRRPPSSQQLRQVASDPHLQRHSGVSMDEDTRRLSDNMEERGEVRGRGRLLVGH